MKIWKPFLLVYLSLITNLVMFSQDNSQETFNNIKLLEQKYKEKIIALISPVFEADRKYTVDVTVLPITQNFNLNDRNTYKTKVSVIIDGKWEFELYQDKNRKKYTIEETGIRKRNYIEINKNDLDKIKSMIINLVDYKMELGDDIVVENIRFNRQDDFFKQDSIWKRKQQVTLAVFAALISLILLIILTLTYRVIEKEIMRRKLIMENKLKNQNKNDN